MDPLMIVLIILALAILVVLFAVWRKLSNPIQQAPTDTGALVILQGQLAEMTRAMDARLGEGARSMSESLRMQGDQSQQTITNIQAQMDAITNRMSQQLVEVVKGVTQTQESTKQVFVIAEQLNNLEKVLKNQKQRGNLGEASLELVMSNILPPGAYAMQYEFPGGETVDAIIRTKEGFIPVDAKFPLENYTRIHDEKDDARRAEYQEAFKRDLKSASMKRANMSAPKMARCRLPLCISQQRVSTTTYLTTDLARSTRAAF